MIDTHSHLNFKVFDNNYKEVIKRSLDNGVQAIINIGTDLESSKKVVAIANEFQNCYAAVGLHPTDIEKENFDPKKYINLVNLNQDKIKAIGETGLDYYHITNNAERDKQKEIFKKHLELAQKLNLPIIIHCRGSKENPKDAYLEILSILSSLSFIPRGVIHCFTSDLEIAQKFLNLGFYLGFTGVITFKNTHSLFEVVKNVDLNRILIETDCPFLAPEPHRGEQNEPSYVRFVAEKIAEIKELSLEEIIKITTQNAIKLFNLPRTQNL
ncbi:MAG: TatD family hydrolase [Patescibacteria group bacterium]|nr:TatD family hydrolase [Patescibacteria group bacterium]MDD5164391.1 TatD family hydrolase [Patescibacteria group bacterium]MDD5534957.1 TatD family hydrolase [Patescibacteria group bacterium]